MNTIQYYLAGGELSETEVEQITEWEDYNGTFKIGPNNRYVVYVKITDNAGSISYINSDGIVLDKPADPNSPATGDNSNMALWIALLFISGGAVITLTVVDRKRRTASKR